MPYLITTLGHKIYYEKHGHAGPVLILLHGLASSTRIWIRQVRTLSEYCRIYAFDFPGHGQSEWLAHYSIESLSELLRELMDECGIQQASLAAISLGCSVALTFAANYPERVDKLILEGPMGGCHTLWHPAGWLDWSAFILLPDIIYLSLHLFGYHATSHWLNTFGVKSKRNFKFLEAAQNQTDFKAIRELLWDSACPPYFGKLERITAPILLIRGQNDPMPLRFVNYIRTHLSRVTYLEMSGTRHLVALEKPREFNIVIMKFLDLDVRQKGKSPHEHSA